MKRNPFSHAMLSVNPNAGYFLFSKLSIFAIVLRFCLSSLIIPRCDFEKNTLKLDSAEETFRLLIYRYHRSIKKKKEDI